MAVIAFVPVRCGSKSIPFKNIKDFCGKPLVYWVLNALQKAEVVSEIIVATDCDEISEIVDDFNFNKLKVFKRSEENSKDSSSTESVILEYLNQAVHTSNDDFILCQATSPLTQSQDIDKGYHFFKSGNYDSILSCCRIKRFFWQEDGTPTNYDYKNRPRRQDFNGNLVENGAIYINSISNILSSKNRLSGNIGVFEMPEYTFYELDENEDWIIAEMLMRKFVIQKKKESKIKLFLTDIDGVLTDAGMYYSENGDELKKFSTYDGMGLSLLAKRGVKTGIITSEDRHLNKKRAEKLNVDFLYQGAKNKLKIAESICKGEGITLNEVAYIGDDINDAELLQNVGFAACPANSQEEIKKIPGILLLQKSGGEGVVREFIEIILEKKLIE